MVFSRRQVSNQGLISGGELVAERSSLFLDDEYTEEKWTITWPRNKLERFANR